ncbi:hypothetical protein PR048_033664, partial [Dryococelus australis]
MNVSKSGHDALMATPNIPEALPKFYFQYIKWPRWRSDQWRLAKRVRFPASSPPGVSRVGILPDDAAGRRVFSGVSRFPHPFHSGAVTYSPRFALIEPNLSIPTQLAIREGNLNDLDLRVKIAFHANEATADVKRLLAGAACPGEFFIGYSFPIGSASSTSPSSSSFAPAAPNQPFSKITTSNLTMCYVFYKAFYTCVHDTNLFLTKLGPRLLAPHQGDPGSIPGRVTPDFRMWESCRTMPLVGGFSRGSPVSPALSFRRCSILTSITLIGSQDLDVKSMVYCPGFSQRNSGCGEPSRSGPASIKVRQVSEPGDVELRRVGGGGGGGLRGSGVWAIVGEPTVEEPTVEERNEQRMGKGEMRDSVYIYRRLLPWKLGRMGNHHVNPDSYLPLLLGSGAKLNMISRLLVSAVYMTSERNEREVVSIPGARTLLYWRFIVEGNRRSIRAVRYGERWPEDCTDLYRLFTVKSLSCAFKVKKRGSDTGDTNTHALAPHRSYEQGVQCFHPNA